VKSGCDGADGGVLPGRHNCESAELDQGRRYGSERLQGELGAAEEHVGSVAATAIGMDRETQSSVQIIGDRNRLTDV
jgi:hypothetical protein